jgi:hypothetical protein
VMQKLGEDPVPQCWQGQANFDRDAQVFLARKRMFYNQIGFIW